MEDFAWRRRSERQIAGQGADTTSLDGEIRDDISRTKKTLITIGGKRAYVSLEDTGLVRVSMSMTNVWSLGIWDLPFYRTSYK